MNDDEYLFQFKKKERTKITSKNSIFHQKWKTYSTECQRVRVFRILCLPAKQDTQKRFHTRIEFGYRRLRHRLIYGSCKCNGIHIGIMCTVYDIFRVKIDCICYSGTIFLFIRSSFSLSVTLIPSFCIHADSDKSHFAVKSSKVERDIY